MTCPINFLHFFHILQHYCTDLPGRNNVSMCSSYMGLVLLFYYDSTAMTHISICGSSVDICIRWAQQTSKATPAGVTQLAKCKHGQYSRMPGEPHTGGTTRTPLGPRFDIATCLPAEAPNWEQHGTSGCPCQAKITPFRLFKKLLQQELKKHLPRTFSSIFLTFFHSIVVARQRPCPQKCAMKR